MVFFAALYYITVTHWLTDPSLGIVVIAILSVLLGLGVTVLTAGLSNRKALYTSMTTVALGVALWYPLQFFFHDNMSFLRLVLLLVIAIAVGIVIGYLFGGDDKGLSARTGALTAFATSFVIFTDRLMRAWNTYIENPAVGGRPIKTQLPATPNIKGDFWIITTDTLTHLILPTLTLMLISLATHSRFARASMLEVMNQDYIRTARSKGLTERTVVMRHAFRNALIPMATVVAFDIAGADRRCGADREGLRLEVAGVAVPDGLTNSDPNPMMAFFVVGAVIAVLANLLADIAYAALDPRIRLDLMTISIPSDPHRDRHAAAGARREDVARAAGGRRSLPGPDRPQALLPAQGRDDLARRADPRPAAGHHQHRLGPDPGLVEVELLGRWSAPPGDPGATLGHLRGSAATASSTGATSRSARQSSATTTSPR